MDIWSHFSWCILRKITVTLLSATEKLHRHNAPKWDVFSTARKTHYLVTYHKNDSIRGAFVERAATLPWLFLSICPQCT